MKKGKSGAQAPEAGARSWVEEIEITGDRLLGEVKRLAGEASVRRIRVIEPDGDVAVDIPLAVGAVAGGAVVLAAPALAIVGTLAALVAKVRVEIVREEEKDGG